MYIYIYIYIYTRIYYSYILISPATLGESAPAPRAPRGGAPPVQPCRADSEHAIYIYIYVYVYMCICIYIIYIYIYIYVYIYVL